MQVNEYLLRIDISEPSQRSKTEHFGKVIIGFNYFLETVFWVLNMS